MSAFNSRAQKMPERRSPAPKPFPTSKSFVESMAMEMLLSARTSPPVHHQAPNIDEERSLQSSRSAASGSSFSSNGSLVDQLEDSITEPELLSVPSVPSIPAKAPKPVSVFSISDFMKNVAAPAAVPLVPTHRPSAQSNTSHEQLTTEEDANEDRTAENTVENAHEEVPDEDSWVTDSSGLPPMGSEHSVRSVHSHNSDHSVVSEHAGSVNSVLSDTPYHTEHAYHANHYDKYNNPDNNSHDHNESSHHIHEETNQVDQEEVNEVVEEEVYSSDGDNNTEGNSLEDQLAHYKFDDVVEQVDQGVSVVNTANVHDTTTLSVQAHNADTTTIITTPTPTNTTVHNPIHNTTSDTTTNTTSNDSTTTTDEMLLLSNRSVSSEFRVDNPMYTKSNTTINIPPPVATNTITHEVVNTVFVEEETVSTVVELVVPPPVPTVVPSITPPVVSQVPVALPVQAPLSEIENIVPPVVLSVPSVVPEPPLVPTTTQAQETVPAPIPVYDEISRSRSESPPPPPPTLPPVISSDLTTTTAANTTDTTHNLTSAVKTTTLPFPSLPLPSQMLPAQLDCDESEMDVVISTGVVSGSVGSGSGGNNGNVLQYVNMYIPTTSTISADDEQYSTIVPVPTLTTITLPTYPTYITATSSNISTGTADTTTPLNTTTPNTTTTSTTPTTYTNTTTPTSARARGRHLSPSKVRGSTIAATATPTMSVPVADSGRVDRYRNKSAVRGSVSSGGSSGSGSNGVKSEGLLSGGSNSKINAGRSTDSTVVTTAVSTCTDTILSTPTQTTRTAMPTTPSLTTTTTTTNTTDTNEAPPAITSTRTLLPLHEELDLLVQYKSSLLLQTQLVDKLIQQKRSLVEVDGSQDPRQLLRVQIGIDITTEMLQKCAMESAALSSTLLGSKLHRVTSSTNSGNVITSVDDAATSGVLSVAGVASTGTTTTPARSVSRNTTSRTNTINNNTTSAVSTPPRPLTNTYSHGPHATPQRTNSNTTNTTTTTPTNTKRQPSPLTTTTTNTTNGTRADSIRRNSLGNIIPSPLRRASSVNRTIRTPITKASNTTNTTTVHNDIEPITTPTNISTIHNTNTTNTTNTMRSIELFPTSPMDTFRRNAAMVNSMLGNIDNYCTCCRTKLVDMDAHKNTRLKHSGCKTCIHRK